MSKPLTAEEVEGLREHEGHPLLGVCPLDMQQRPCRTARWLATLAARAASPAAPDIDVERLARAEHIAIGHKDQHPDFRGCSHCTPHAESVARAYREASE